MNAPRRERDPERDKRNAIALVAHAAEKILEAERSTGIAIHFAMENGASLAEIANGTGLSASTVERLATEVAERRNPRPQSE